MYPQWMVAERFVTCFDKNALNAFRAFMANNPYDKWTIASDYAIGDGNRAGDAFSFSIVPHDAMPDDFKKEVQQALPKDIKRSKEIEAEGVAWLRSGRAFHVTFRPDRGRQVFRPLGDAKTPIEAARTHLDLTIAASVGNPGVSAASLKRFKKLRHEANANNFAVDRLGDIYLLGLFFAVLTALIQRERKAEIIGWFSDRDNMTSWCDGVWYDYGDWALRAICDGLDLDLQGTRFGLGLPELTGKTMWYDQMIRASDWFAGAIAAYDLENNKCPSDPKYRQMLEEVIADNDQFALFKVSFPEVGPLFSRVLIKRNRAET